jgi:hypothetical protein
MIGGRNMLGAGVNPNAFKYDFSGAYEIGKAYARGIENAGGSISNTISSIGKTTGDYFKQQGEKKKQVKTASTQIDAALKLMPELAPILGDVGNRLKDEDVSLSDRYADASIVGDLIKNSMSGLMSQQMMNLRQQKFAASQGGGGGGDGSRIGGYF